MYIYRKVGAVLVERKELIINDLIEAEEEAFTKQREAFGILKKSERAVHYAREQMDEAWQKRADARERMNHEYDLRKYEREYHDMIWKNFREIRDRNSESIKLLREKSDAEHAEMVSCFSKANEAREKGDFETAEEHAAEGKKHREARNIINRDTKKLINEIKVVKQYAYKNGRKADSWAYELAKKEYEKYKELHEKAKKEFYKKKDECAQAEKDFNYWDKRQKRLKDELLQRA